MDPSKTVPDLSCEVHLLLEVVDLVEEVPGLRSSGIPPPNLVPADDVKPMNFGNHTDGGRQPTVSWAQLSSSKEYAKEEWRWTICTV